MEIRLKPLVVGIIKKSTTVKKLLPVKTGGTNYSEYCYSVWLRHLVKIRQQFPNQNLQNVAELGPGDTIGIGLAALLSGAEKYHALDIVSYWNTARNIQIFEELISLFKKRAKIPDQVQFPNVKPRLDNYCFPESLLTEKILGQSLNEARLERIRFELKNPFDNQNRHVHYNAPWSEDALKNSEVLNLVFSQAVMEHIDDIETTYKCLNDWLKLGGLQSHTIDFKSHGFTKSWNGHWTISSQFWKLIVGGRSYSINRLPVSNHIMLVQNTGNKIVVNEPTISVNNLNKKLAKEYQYLSESDLTTSGVYILALKESKHF